MHQLLSGLSATALLVGIWGSLSPESFADTGHAHPPVHGMPQGEQGSGHAHAEIEVPMDQAIPTVRLQVYPDAIAGWNLHIETQNWVFAPAQVNQSSLTTEGHAHLYLNGEKLTRLYGHWYYLPSLPPGDHTLTVALNANGHEALMHQGQPIAASVSLSVPSP